MSGKIFFNLSPAQQAEAVTRWENNHPSLSPGEYELFKTPPARRRADLALGSAQLAVSQTVDVAAQQVDLSTIHTPPAEQPARRLPFIPRPVLE